MKYQQPEAGVREAGVPAGIPAGIVELVVDVPAEHAVAETTLLFEQAGKFVHTDVFATDDTVYVRQTQLHFGDTFFPVLGHFLRQQAFVFVGHAPLRYFG